MIQQRATSVIQLAGALDVEDRAWRFDGACAQPGVPLDLWSAENESARLAALHVCHRHCPVGVRKECDAEARDFHGTPDEYRSMVVGGRLYDKDGEPVERDLPARRCPLCPVVVEGLPAAEWPRIGSRKPGRGRLRKDGADAPPCGTEAAFARHRRRHEAIDEACRLEHNRAVTARNQQRLAATPCGTEAAYGRHVRRGEPVDEACLEARRAANRERDDRKRRQAAAAEAVAS